MTLDRKKDNLVAISETNIDLLFNECSNIVRTSIAFKTQFGNNNCKIFSIAEPLLAKS